MTCISAQNAPITQEHDISCPSTPITQEYTSSYRSIPTTPITQEEYTQSTAPSTPNNMVNAGAPKLAPLHFFGLMLAHLPTLGTPPSAEYPLTNPVAFTLGLDIRHTGDAPARNPIIHLIHAMRLNVHDASQLQIFATLSDATSLHLPCPGYTDGTDHIHFVAPSAATTTPLVLELLAKLETMGLVVRTGAIVGNGAQEYRILLPLEKLSKLCGRCGRWEALVKRDVGQLKKHRLMYRRWRTCGGCGVTWFCRNECFKRGWEQGHWKDCELARIKHGHHAGD